MLSRILIFGLLVSNLFGNDRWSSNIDYKEVIAKAQSGSAYFQGLLGIYLRSGESGCMVDAELSRQWSEVSSKQGHPFGTYNLANLAILNGDFEKATNLYQDAALLLQRKASDGDPVAMYCMGEIDFQVIPTNVPRALDWFKKSAEMGYPQAQATVGALYLKGLPGLLEKDEKEGIQLLSKAVLSKSLTARYNLGMAYYNGDGVLKNMEKAIQWLRIAEKQNFSEAQYTLGLILLEGQGGVSKNTSEGLRLLNKASKQNHQLAKIYLEKRQGNLTTDKASDERMEPGESDILILEEARKFYTGVGRPKNYEKAYELFYPLAQGGHPEASRFVGLMKLTGKGTARDIEAARQWLSVAAQKGDQQALRMLKEYKSLF